MAEIPWTDTDSQAGNARAPQLRMRDRRRDGERRKCVMFVEHDRRIAARRSGMDRRQIAAAPSGRLLYRMEL